MTNEPTISYWIDHRRTTKKGLLPVKLMVYQNNPKKRKMYGTGIYVTSSFSSSLKNGKTLRGDNKKKLSLINEYVKRAETTAQEMKTFSFSEFEKKFFRKKGDVLTPNYWYQQIIDEKKKINAIGTADNYRLSLASIENFIKDEDEKSKIDTLSFYEINKSFLEEYEAYMLDKKNSKYSTVGIYLRPLRAVFNRAIKEGYLSDDNYPFERNKNSGYVIPQSDGTKRALTQKQIKLLFEAKPKTENQQKAKDFWFFSYTCNGMNIKDIANLKFKDLEDDHFYFYREKTKRTTKNKLKKVKVYLNDFSSQIIEKYANQDKISENYVFDILSIYDTQEEKHRKVKNFVKFINDHMKRQIKANQLDIPIVTVQWARHSFSTIAIKKGVSMEFMQESFGHKSIKTTQNYFSGFDDETRKEFAQNNMDF